LNEPDSNAPIDPKVRRRTLSIVGGFFLFGFSLAVFWMSKEVFRVSRIQRIPADDVAPASAGARTNSSSGVAKPTSP
jgi:hypothetical protein